MKVYLRSLDDQTQFPIEEGENLLLGRLEPCDIVIEDGSVSSQHARLSFSEGVLVVADLNSTNGTRLNYSLLVEPKVLMDGDTVEFGSVSFIVDGPGLRSGSVSALDSAWVEEFRPVNFSGAMGSTMPLPDLNEAADPGRAESRVETDLERVEEESADERFPRARRYPPDSDWNDEDGFDEDDAEAPGCTLGRILATALFLLVFAGLMGLYLWHHVPAR